MRNVRIADDLIQANAAGIAAGEKAAVTPIAVNPNMIKKNENIIINKLTSL